MIRCIFCEYFQNVYSVEQLLTDIVEIATYILPRMIDNYFIPIKFTRII